MYRLTKWKTSALLMTWYECDSTTMNRALYTELKYWVTEVRVVESREDRGIKHLYAAEDMTGKVRGLYS